MLSTRFAFLLYLSPRCLKPLTAGCLFWACQASLGRRGSSWLRRGRLQECERLAFICCRVLSETAAGLALLWQCAFLALLLSASGHGTRIYVSSTHPSSVLRPK